VLRHIPVTPRDPRVLLGLEARDDAAVYALRKDLALVQTVDFITPIVDDPYAFGAIGAANALSDIYAMGARPVTALNIVAFPIRSLPLATLQEILRGAAETVAEAGAAIVGGHTIDDLEPKFGLAVAGLAHPDRIVRKAGGRPGDALILTKPLGTGILTTALDRRLIGEEDLREAVAVMRNLNRAAAEAMLEVGVHACTDVTGFGLLGHLHELAEASSVSAHVSLKQIPVLPGVWDLARRDAVPGGSRNNQRYLMEHVTWGEGIKPEEQVVLCDAQTSGGLLVAVSPRRRSRLVAALRKRGVLAAEIGKLTRGNPGRITVARS
jgi:selenide,water dikinase